MEKLLASFLKSMGLTPDYIQDKMNEFARIVKTYDARLARVEENQHRIMAALKIDAPSNNAENVALIPIDRKAG